MSNGDNVRQAYDCIRVYRTALETWRVPFGLDLGFGENIALTLVEPNFDSGSPWLSPGARQA